MSKEYLEEEVHAKLEIVDINFSFFNWMLFDLSNSVGKEKKSASQSWLVNGIADKQK